MRFKGYVDLSGEMSQEMGKLPIDPYDVESEAEESPKWSEKVHRRASTNPNSRRYPGLFGGWLGVGLSFSARGLKRPAETWAVFTHSSSPCYGANKFRLCRSLYGGELIDDAWSGEFDE